LPELYLESAHSVNYPFGRKGLGGDSRTRLSVERSATVFCEGRNSSPQGTQA
jgi:hypothetical protein